MGYTALTFVAYEQPTAAKWNLLPANDASFNDGTGIGAGAITPEKLFTGAGTTWPLQSWTPTLTNLTIGNGSTVATYVKIGKLIFYRIAITLGSTSSISGTVQFTLPVTAKTGYADREPHGNAVFNDTGVQIYHGKVHAAPSNPTTRGEFVIETVSATYPTNTVLSSTVPFTWATADNIVAEGWYEAA